MTAQKLNGRGGFAFPRLGRSLHPVQWVPGITSADATQATNNYLVAIHQLRCGLELKLLQQGHPRPEQEADRMIRAAFTAPSRRGH